MTRHNNYGRLRRFRLGFREVLLAQYMGIFDCSACLPACLLRWFSIMKGLQNTCTVPLALYLVFLAYGYARHGFVGESAAAAFLLFYSCFVCEQTLFP